MDDLTTRDVRSPNHRRDAFAALARSVVTVLACAGCGEVTSVVGTDGAPLAADDATSETSGPDADAIAETADAADTADVGVPCPAKPPEFNAACIVDGQRCHYTVTPATCGGEGAYAFDSICVGGGWIFNRSQCSEFPPDYAGPAPICPSVATTGGSCPVEGLVCAFGDGSNPKCRPQITCTHGAWVDSTPACPPQPSEPCPATSEAAQRTACTTLSALCRYGAQLCECAMCSGGCTEGPPTWYCDAPPSAGCPAGSPNLGTPCTKYGLRCDYGGVCYLDTATSVQCEAGVWVTDKVGGCTY